MARSKKSATTAKAGKQKAGSPLRNRTFFGESVEKRCNKSRLGAEQCHRYKAEAASEVEDARLSDLIVEMNHPKHGVYDCQVAMQNYEDAIRHRALHDAYLYEGGDNGPARGSLAAKNQSVFKAMQKKFLSRCLIKLPKAKKLPYT